MHFQTPAELVLIKWEEYWNVIFYWMYLINYFLVEKIALIFVEGKIKDNYFDLQNLMFFLQINTGN